MPEEVPNKRDTQGTQSKMTTILIHFRDLMVKYHQQVASSKFLQAVYPNSLTIIKIRIKWFHYPKSSNKHLLKLLRKIFKHKIKILNLIFKTLGHIQLWIFIRKNLVGVKLVNIKVPNQY